MPYGLAIKEGIGLLGGLITGILGIFKKKQERKLAKEDHKMKMDEALTNAKIEKAQKREDADIKWEQTSLEQSGWKDEFFLVVIAAPIIACFFPWLVPHVKSGFLAIREVIPDSWMYLFYLMAGAAYGSKKVLNFFQSKHGG